jgi:hypothetical protein
VVAAQLGEIEARRDGAGIRQRAQRGERACERGDARQAPGRLRQHLAPAVEFGQQQQRVARLRRQPFGERAQRRQVFFLQRFEQLDFQLVADAA